MSLAFLLLANQVKIQYNIFINSDEDILVKHFKTKEDFFNRANDKLKKFIKEYTECEDGEHELNMSYLRSTLIECDFRYVTFEDKALNDIYCHYARIPNETNNT